jgi:hypothetical protein
MSRPKGWYKQLTIRPVLPVGGYQSYEKICGHVADIYFPIIDEEQIMRRGFLKNQAYGEGRQERKLVWIEPVFVLGGE